MHARDALVELGGISDRAELLRHCARRDLDKAVDQGQIVRIRRGLYSLPDVDEAALLARQCHGAVSHLSAALHQGWKVWMPPSEPMITVPRTSRGGATACLFWSTLTPRELERGVTEPARTVVDCARVLPLAEAEASPRTGRSRACRVVRLASGLSANPFESVLRGIAIDIPGFAAVPQCQIGPVWHCDVGDPELRIALEAESYEFHALREAFDYDCRRYTSMVCMGWLVLRFTWQDVRHRPDQVREAIQVATRSRS